MWMTSSRKCWSTSGKAFPSSAATAVTKRGYGASNTCCKVERGKKRNVPTVPLLIDKDVLSESNEVGRQVKMLYDRINRLELFDRAIILLWLESMSYDEIAAIVGISTSAVTSRLFRIKEQLKSMSNH